jgi:hypothetical protein
VNPRSQSKRERFRQAVLALHGPTCRMPVCVMPTRAIDLTLKAPHRASYTADHIIEVDVLTRRGGDPFDVTNGRPAHWACNSKSGATYGNRTRRTKRRAIDPLNRSRAW